jgi:hypothetical protein
MTHDQINRIRHDLAVISSSHSDLMSRRQYVQDVAILLREVNRLQTLGQRDPLETRLSPHDG